MPREGTNLTKFLVKHSTKGSNRNVYKLYAQWRVIEIRDCGKRRQLRCHCGRTNLRYLVFIQNRITRVQTYVGTDCAKYFSRQTLPRVLNLLESIASSGITGTYIGRSGKWHRFRLDPGSQLVRHRRLLSHFFRRVPISRGQKGWQVRMVMGRRFPKPRLRRNRSYRIKVGAMTPSKRKGQKPMIVLYADRIAG